MIIEQSEERLFFSAEENQYSMLHVGERRAGGFIKFYLSTSVS